MNHEKVERNLEMLEMWRAGKTFREIGERFGLCNSSAHRIVMRRLQTEEREKAERIQKEEDGE